MKRSPDNIILTGFMASGKSVIAREVARRIGWKVIDTDDEVVRAAGKPIADIFAEFGEKKFREMESKALREACRHEKTVVATGGGAVTIEENRRLMKECGFVVRLEARPATVFRRLQQEDASGTATPRPLLAGGDALETIERLKTAREEFYATADMTVHTDEMSVDSVCQEVIKDWQQFARTVRPGPPQRLAAEVRTATEHYPIYVGWGILDTVGDRMRQAGLSGRAIVISDANVMAIYGNRIKSALEATQYRVICHTVPAGETSKSIEQAVKIYDLLVTNRVERGDTIVALGGGVVGDLAGYAAAGFLRGLPFVQVPTSLVAMVDASIGGKVAINHPQAKNLVGAFYQPRFVLADVQTLTTLPARELTSGWAEVIKHGLILDPGLFGYLKSGADSLLRLDPGSVVEAVAQNAAIKARVVTEDEKDLGTRIILNYGHTIAHGLEAATHFERFLHGEAVAIGMLGAARLGQRLKVTPAKLVKEHQAILEKYGLPTSAGGVAVGDVFTAMELDKKTSAGSIRWVFLEDVGRTAIRNNVDQRDVAAVLEELVK